MGIPEPSVILTETGISIPPVSATVITEPPDDSKTVLLASTILITASVDIIVAIIIKQWPLTIIINNSNDCHRILSHCNVSWD